MQRKRPIPPGAGGARSRATYLALLTAAVLGVAAAPASVAGRALARHVLASGATSRSVSSALCDATVGQPFVGRGSDAAITLEHGYWHSLPAEAQAVSLPLLLRGD
jgi:hypothetical protein